MELKELKLLSLFTLEDSEMQRGIVAWFELAWTERKVKLVIFSLVLSITYENLRTYQFINY